MHAFITSKLHLLNSLLLGMPHNQINKLQHIQNIAARIVTRTKRSEHITPVLKQLHWLPIEYRIQFKVLLYVYKALNGCAPGYLSDLIEQYSPPRLLRSDSQLLLCVPKSRTKTYGDRAFANIAPRLWNNLPPSIRCAKTVEAFKRHLKTHLFKCAFE